MSTVRIAGRMLARELKPEEVSDVSGGYTYRPTFCGGSSDEFNYVEDDCGV